MATIIQGGTWNITEAAAEHLVAQNVLYKCDANHVDAEEFALPIYHLTHTAPHYIGSSTLGGLIKEAEEAVQSLEHNKGE